MRDRSVDRTPTTTQTCRQRWADRLARYTWLVLGIAVALALVGGVVYAAAWQPRTGAVEAPVDACANPPCFGGGDLPGVRDLPLVIPVLGYLLPAKR